MIDPAIFSMPKLLEYLVSEQWQRECVIIPEYMPPFPNEQARPKCVVRLGEGKDAVFLRYSKGPKQEHFWDVYGDDYHNPELALIALARAPAPPLGKLYYEFRFPVGQGPASDNQERDNAG